MLINTDDTLSVYGVDLQTRSLCTIESEETDVSLFLIGTQSLRELNQVHLVLFNDADRSLKKQIFTHSCGDIWDIARCDFDSKLFITQYGSLNETKTDYCMKASLWRLPDTINIEDNDSMTDTQQEGDITLVQDFALDDYDPLKCLCAHPNNAFKEIAALTETRLILLKPHGTTDCSDFVPAQVLSLSEGSRNRQKVFSRIRWNPNAYCTEIAAVSQRSIYGFDIRSQKPNFHIENAHVQLVRDIDYNPYGQYYLASCGDDCAVKVWDVRNCHTPMKTFGGVHSHWIWTVRFNPSRDLLLLTGSSDSRVALYSLPSCILRSNIETDNYSDQYVEEEDEGEDDIVNGNRVDNDNKNDKNLNGINAKLHSTEQVFDSNQQNRCSTSSHKLTDEVIKVFEDHEDSVYACEWSATDPWIFASLSYDGRIIISRVPPAEKIRIIRSNI